MPSKPKRGPRKQSTPNPGKTKTKTKAKSKGSRNGSQKTRLWLTYPQQHITRPLVWELSQRFRVITNIRQASVTEQIGIVSLELEGQRSHIKAAIKWLENLDVRVEPVEINVIES